LVSSRKKNWKKTRKKLFQKEKIKFLKTNSGLNKSNQNLFNEDLIMIDHETSGKYLYYGKKYRKKMLVGFVGIF